MVHRYAHTYYVGKAGAFTAALLMCETGSVGRSGSTVSALAAVDVWNPLAMIMVGIAFGRDPQRQKVGDVLVADEIIPYETQRVGRDETVSRAKRTQVGPILLNRFRNAQNWTFRSPAGLPCNVHFGPVLSGEKLVDNTEFKERLFDEYPTAIGGEMEGAGLLAAGEIRKVEWILVKAICDWADGQKGKEHQPFAAAAAADLVVTVLNEPTVLHGLRRAR